MRLFVFVTLLITVSPLHADDGKVVEDAVAPFLKDRPYLGVVVGVLRGGERQYFGFGEVTLEGQKRKPDENTIFEIGSITKAFTGTLLADQVLAGRIRLDDPAQKYLPSDWKLPRYDGRDISLLHLATHTSSLPVQPPYIGAAALLTKNPRDPYAEYDEKKLKKMLSSLDVDLPIGAKFDYSNLGVGLLGHAIARAGGAANYETLLIDRIATPLGLADTRVTLTPDQARRQASGFDKDGKPASAWTFATLEACGGLRSGVRDMLTFAEAANGKKETPLKKAFEFAQQPWRETGSPDGYVGLCWFRDKFSESKTLIWHNGGTGGYRSFLGLVPDSGVAVVVLSNSTNRLDALARKILKDLHQSR